MTCLPCLLAANPSPRRSKMRDPGPLALLGYARKILVSRNGEEVRIDFGEGEPMFWSPKLRALLVIPDPDVSWRWSSSSAPGDRISDAKGASRLFARWSAREATRIGVAKVPDAKLVPYGKGLHIIYRSDKWHRGLDTDYIHKFSDKVRVAMSDEKNRDGAPKIIVIGGGRFTVTERGLVY